MSIEIDIANARRLFKEHPEAAAEMAGQIDTNGDHVISHKEIIAAMAPSIEEYIREQGKQLSLDEQREFTKTTLADAVVLFRETLQDYILEVVEFSPEELRDATTQILIKINPDLVKQV